MNKRSHIYRQTSQPASDEDFVAASTTLRTPGPAPCMLQFQIVVRDHQQNRVAFLLPCLHDCSMSDETVVTLGSLSGGARSHRKPGDCRRLWHSESGTACLVLYDDKNDKCVCLKCNKTMETMKKYSLQRHYESNHSDTMLYFS